MRKILLGMSILFLLLAVGQNASATLMGIGTATYLGSQYNLIYDNDTNLVWLDYTKSAANWATQTAWATSLNSSGVLTYNLIEGINVIWSGDWRLPTVPNPTVSSGNQGYYPNVAGIVNSELGHLYYTELGNTYGLNKFVNKGPFLNLLSSNTSGTSGYWTGSTYSGSNVWTFYTYYTTQGYQATNAATSYNNYAIAVRSGEVVAAPVPEPATLLLLGSGLVGLAGLGRRKFMK